jgi:8-amino-7-oxononanoate synthase
LQELVTKFRAGAADLGLEMPNSQTPIQPVLLGTAEAAVELSQTLEAAGLLITAIRPPTVPAGTSRLRITFTAEHTDEDLQRLLDALATAMEKTELGKN